MKKSISFLAIIFIAVLSFNISAQSSNLFGTWYGTTTPVQNDGMKGSMVPVMNINADNTGTFGFEEKLKGSMGNGVTVEVTISFSAPTIWSFDGSNIHFQIDNYNSTITVPRNKVKFTGTNTQLIKTLNRDKDELIEILKHDFIDTSMLPNEAYWENLTVTNSTLTFYEDGQKITFKKKAASSSKSSSKKSSKRR